MASKTVTMNKSVIEEHRLYWKLPKPSKMEVFATKHPMVPHFPFRVELGSGIGLPMTLKGYWNCYKAGAHHSVSATLTWANIPVRHVEDHYCSLSMEIKKGNGEHVNARPSKVVGVHRGMSEFLYLDPTIIPPYCVDEDNLSLEIEVSLFTLSRISPRQDVTCTSLSHLESLFKGKFTKIRDIALMHMFSNPELPSPAPMMVKVVASDGREFSVNRGILAVRSPVFLSMFQTPMQEVNNGIVNVNDISGNAMEAIFAYIHAGALPLIWKDPEVVAEFTYAAHKYMLKELLEFLDLALGFVCTPQNCVNLLRLAKQLSLGHAEKALLKYVKAKLTDSSWEEVFSNM